MLEAPGARGPLLHPRLADVQGVQCLAKPEQRFRELPGDAQARAESPEVLHGRLRVAGIQREEVLARTPLECDLVEARLRAESRGNAGRGGKKGTPMSFRPDVYGRNRGRPSGQAHRLDEQLQ